MEPETIKNKLQKYFEGESSLEDERILHDYFRSNKIDAAFLPYRDLFAGLESMKSYDKQLHEEDLMDFILENEHREKIRYRKFWQIVTGIAAALMIALLVVHYTKDKTNWKDTYSDPDQAYAVAAQTLHYVAGKYREGISQLQPVSKLNHAVQPMNKGFGLLNKGFYEMENLDKLTKKQKK